MDEPLREKVTKTKRIIWLIIILLLILIIASIIYLLLVYYKPATNNNLNENNTNQEATLPETPPSALADFNKPNQEVLAGLVGNNPPETANNAKDKNEALVIATAFAERFGSYSNQGNFANLDDLSIFMTEAMKKWIATYKKDLIAQYPDFNTYYAIETKAISKQIKSIDEKAGTSEVVVKTQRQEFKVDLNNPRVYYQDILLKLVRADNQWKVNGAYWQ
jgi:hypothetical protein